MIILVREIHIFQHVTSGWVKNSRNGLCMWMPKERLEASTSSNNRITLDVIKLLNFNCQAGKLSFQVQRIKNKTVVLVLGSHQLGVECCRGIQVGASPFSALSFQLSPCSDAKHESLYGKV